MHYISLFKYTIVPFLRFLSSVWTSGLEAESHKKAVEVGTNSEMN